MPETHIPPIFYARGLADMLIVTDGRTSGSTRGPMVLHVAPEAAAGGPIAIVEEGDEIRIDIAKRSLDLLVSDQEYKRRAASQARPIASPEHLTTGWMEMYTRMVGCASQGAQLRFNP
jgi:dihydroxy-acid dehydratase